MITEIFDSRMRQGEWQRLAACAGLCLHRLRIWITPHVQAAAVAIKLAESSGRIWTWLPCTEY